MLPRSASIVSVAVVIGLACAAHQRRPDPTGARIAPASPLPTSARPADPVATFQQSIRPILASHCGQCHEAGGRMYAKLPFDDPEVVRAHGESVLRRLKDPEEHDTVRRWLTSGGSDR